jgi:uncharacterized protein
VETGFLSPKARVRVDARGWGCYAVEPLSAGETVAAFGGRCVTRAMFETLPAIDRLHSIQIDDDLYMVGDAGELPGAKLGHSCAPNCGVRGGVVIVAMRDIAIGEQLSYDYAMSNGSDFNEFECRCGAATCRHKITGSDWMLPELQLAYRGYFSPYLARRIASLVNTGAQRRAFAL